MVGGVCVRLEEIINRHRQELNDTDMLIYKYILQHRAEVRHISIHELAKSCAVSSTTIVRFAQKLGFDGFGDKLLIVKSRTNQAGQVVNLVYDKVKGMDSLRSSVEFAKSLGYLNGNKNAYYLGDNKDIKFTKKNMHEDFKENTDLYKTLYGYIVPELESRLSTITPEEMEVVDEELNY